MEIEVYLIERGEERKLEKAIQEIPNVIESIKELGATPLEDVIILKTNLFDKYPPEIQERVKEICETYLRSFGISLFAAITYFVSTKMKDETSINTIKKGLEKIDEELNEL